jgi:16S rRNA (guanine527-N7)-methyltransferase
LTPGQFEAFEAFESRLYEANAMMNLTRVSQEECWLRHFMDSLLFQDLIQEGTAVLDIGSGPGFPAWPLACARPDLNVVAIDSSGKMIRFLSKSPLPNLKAVLVRAEEWKIRDAFDFVTGRALAPLGIQLELSAPLTRLGGVVVPMRTPAEATVIEQDVSPLGLELVQVHRRTLPGTDVVRVFPVYKKVNPTPDRYPRTWAEIKRRPLI